MALVASYSTVTKVLMTLPIIGSATNITSTVICNFIGHAQSIINAKISAKYILPLATTPDIIETICTDLAIYGILSRRIENALSDSWKAAYKESLGYLDQIANGEMILVDSSGQQISSKSQSSMPWSNTKEWNPTFHEGSVYAWGIDPDKLDDIEDDRLF